MTARRSIQVRCGSCGGTGLYEGFAEASGEPVICVNCKGTGAETLYYTPYTGRVHKTGVRKVHQSRGRSIADGVGSVPGTGMTYSEFQQKIPEAPIQR